MKYDPLNDLIHAIPTSRLLLQKAHEEGALIEGLCLYVSTIDALLRLALVYSRTQDNRCFLFSRPPVKEVTACRRGSWPLFGRSTRGRLGSGLSHAGDRGPS